MPAVIMPKMGDAMEEGTLLRWLKQVGDEVDEGEPLAEIETDKVTLEIEATESGTLTQTLVEEGQAVPIGTPIATIGEAGEPIESGGEPVESATDSGSKAVEGKPEIVKQEARAEEPQRPEVAAAAQTELAAPKAPPVPSGNGAVSPERAPGERLRASPLVKRLAAEHDINLQAIAGTGPGGRIVKDDIMPYVTGAKQAPAAAPAPAPAAPAEVEAPAPVAASAPAAAAGRPAGEVQELNRVRRTTGKRMAESKRTIPHFYVSTDVEMTAAAEFRQQVNAQLGEDAAKVTFNDMIVKAAALALRDVPGLNTSYENDQLVSHPNIDINIAVALDGGLIAPFIPDADQKSLGTIARMSKDLINRAKHGGLLPQEYQGGTFTTSNLGMFDVSEFIAVINPPQAAILAVGSITETAVVKDGKLQPGKVMKITISADHRAVDGADVAKFLIAAKKYLQNPMLLALS
ncbi:MAG TPA: dihydrolipoamide acetyltransferase family protein [Thermomicrobiales bacterium]|nr:dihydrolipoamide acetyltransferase family protein [Thermomicrobiales bacterium]